MSEQKSILVVANETVIGHDLIDAVRQQAEGAQAVVHVICPQSAPRHGLVIYDETVREAAENRLALTIEQLKEIGVEATGEVMDPDPYSAITDAVGERSYDSIVLSTHPETRSGWLRQDLVSRVRSAVDVPVQHIVVELESGQESAHTLVVANQTVGAEALVEKLRELAAEPEDRTFVVVCPQDGVDGSEEAHARLAHMLERLDGEGLHAVGQVTHPDPFTAVQTALEFYNVDAVVISTLPELRSGWLRSDLIGRVRSSTSKPVHHVVAETDAGITETAQAEEV